MRDDCQTCQEITAFEHALDERADAIVKKVNYLCKDVRERNKQRWDGFANLTNLPLFGNMIFDLYRAPSGLEPEPEWTRADWYRAEGGAIEAESRKLEEMKKSHIEHWGDELIEPGFSGDPAGYYTPADRIPRKLCYSQKYCKEITGIEDMTYFAHTPDKYDFSSMAGIGKMMDGAFVLDSISKRVVPQNKCNWSWEDKNATADGIAEIFLSKFARTWMTYKYKT